MPDHRRLALLACLLAAACKAAAQSSPSPPATAEPPAPPAAAERIEITGGRADDTDERRRSTAARIVIGRDEIDKFGDASLGDVLRRLPGVTTPGAPRRGGAPRLRGLGNGYTQLLLDGQRVPPGFSFESLTPEQIERIEILRAPTAETGARAIAGTINIVTREGYRRRSNEVRVAAAVEHGAFAPSASATRNDAIGPLVYNVSLSAYAGRRLAASAVETTDTDNAGGAVTLQQREATDADERRHGVNLTSRLQWRLADGDSVTLAPTLFHGSGSGDRATLLTQPVGTAPARYASALTDADNDNTNARLSLAWRQRLTPASRLEASGYVGGFRSRGRSLRDEFDDGDAAAIRSLADRTTTTERSANAVAKLVQTLGGSDDDPLSLHGVVSGVEVEAVRRSETRESSQLDAGDGDNLGAQSLRLAAYVQDEWSLSPQWALHAGLRWEGIRTRGDAAGGERPSNTSSVATPLLHAVWKPDPKGRDQLRMSLTRSYRAPALGALIAQPTINNRYPLPASNLPTAPDRAGNADLKPEVALGADIAVERYLAGGGLLSANVFARRIRNLLRSVTALEHDPYGAGVDRYVSRQQNVGRATTEGVELEAKFVLEQLVAAAPRVDLRVNVAVFHSKVAHVPGPDDRLDEQARGTANIGADYRLRALPLALGGNVNIVPGYATQRAADQRTTAGAKRVFDLYALWTVDPTLALRLSASNLAPRSYASSNTIVAQTFTETARSEGPSYTNWQLRLELRL